MFENKPPQNLPTASEPQDMLGDADTASTPVPPPSPEMMPPQDLDRTNSDPHSGGFRFGEGGIENGPSALDAGKLRPVAGGMSTEASSMPNMEMPKTQMQAVPESVGGMGTAPLEDSVFSKEKLSRIREDFESYSKENKMSRKKLLEYFGMAELDNKRLGNRLFQCVKSTFSQKKTG